LYERCKSYINRQGVYVEHWGNKFFLTWIFFIFYWHSPRTFKAHYVYDIAVVAHWLQLYYLVQMCSNLNINTFHKLILL
jgi:hypothetical protein